MECTRTNVGAGETRIGFCCRVSSAYMHILGYWPVVGTSVALHFDLEDSWLGVVIFAGPIIVLFGTGV